MATWFTADTHFGHTRIVNATFSTPRLAFSTIEEHDEALVANWNATVGPDDTVWHLGDFSYRCHPRRERALFDRLAGVKHLVRGNHDKSAAALPWASVRDVGQVVADGQGIWLSHYSHRTWPRLHRGDLHLYGHSHGTLPGDSRSLDVGVDCWDYRPVSLAEIRGRMAASDTVPAELRTPAEG
ncbi:metallophosphoesterase [Methylobacterium tardum]|uniref:metallophosphoesterase n=1 Tax=Methylobacterium tardum TaxID=374432 RepID=UPI002021C8A3|nr:metallophosphoesterase [Methylobacterium tardum]URD36594.1 metallophosphoesterase [Methylobacterium tardum]